MFRIMKYLSKAEIGQMLIALVTIVGQVYFDLKLPDYMSDITTLVETPGSDMNAAEDPAPESDRGASSDDEERRTVQ